MSTELSLSTLKENIHTALKSWQSANSDSSSLSDLYLFRKAQLDKTKNARQVANEILLEALQALAVDHDREATLLRKHYLDGLAMYVVANSLNVGESTAYRLQNDALQRLTQILYDSEMVLREKHLAVLRQRLEPPTYTQLIGVKHLLDQLEALLTSSDTPWIISIDGIGGIGKTSLADALSRRLIDRGAFADFGWVSARHHSLNLGGFTPSEDLAELTVEDLVENLIRQLIPNLSQTNSLSEQDALAALRAKLKYEAHLIVIDNLETLSNVEDLLPILRELVNPTKFLLTSRESLHYESGVYHFSPPELSEADTLQLIRYEAQNHNLPDLVGTSDAELQRVFDIVGGNPLALRLVIGQAHVHALNVILEDLATAQGQKADMLYTFIYRRAWNHLNEVTRQVFLAMPLVTERGGDLSYLVSITGLEEASVRDALGHLVTLNLVDSKGGLHQKRYTIHNLTRTFLHKQVAKWNGTD